MTILVISDQGLATHALRSLLLKCRPNAIIESVARLGDAIRLLQRVDAAVDLIVLDIDTPGLGLQSAALLRQLWPDVSLAVVSSADSDAELERCIELGVMGYLSKTTDMPTLAQAFRQILSGLFYLPAPEHLQFHQQNR